MIDVKIKKGILLTAAIFIFGGHLILFGNPLAIQEEYENIDSNSCIECHETGKHNTVISEDISHSVHDGIECLDCHIDRSTLPHKEETDFHVGCQGCRTCHEDASDEYQAHGRALYRGECEDMPQCADCHGDHDVLPSTAKLSKTHPTNLPTTCGVCHTDLDLIEKWQIRTDHPIDVYESSIHGRAVEGGVLTAATCNNCHSVEGTAHKIFSQGNPESSINHFNIPKTCGQCHEDTTNDYWEGIHGQMVKRGDGEAPVCTHCHGEHGIIAASDPRSPVSRARLSEATCSPCHESITLTERYGISTGRRPTFIDNYHGLKTIAGDVFVANCASCHGVHLILPSSDPKSKVHENNLGFTCGECHPGITAELASTRAETRIRNIASDR